MGCSAEDSEGYDVIELPDGKLTKAGAMRRCTPDIAIMGCTMPNVGFHKSGTQNL